MPTLRKPRLATNGMMERVEDGGTVYELPRSKKPSDRNGGYEGVVKQSNLFHAKATLKKGDPQTMLPGPGCATAKEAALRLAKFRAAPYPIVKKDPDRAPKGGGKVRAASLQPSAPALMRRPPRAAQNKRKTYSSGEIPEWVSCTNSLMLYEQDVPLPDELKLSKTEIEKVRRIREWAKQTNAPRIE